MKTNLSYPVLALALLGALSGAGAEKLCAQQAANLPEVPDDAPWNKASLTKISIALAQPSTSEYLLAMARAADANFLVDATEFPMQSPPLTGQWKHFTSSSDGKQWQGYLNELLLALAHERKLTMREFPTRTFLLWSEPDMGMLGRGVSAALPNMTGFQFDPFATMKQQAPVRRALVSYLINDLRWDGRAVREVKSAQLPADLQQQMRALVFQPETILPFASRDTGSGVVSR